MTDPPKSKVMRQVQCPSVVHMSPQTRTAWSTSAEETSRPHVCSRQQSPLKTNKTDGSHLLMTRGWENSQWPLPAWPRRILGRTFVVSIETAAWMFSLLLNLKSKVRGHSSTSSDWNKPLPSQYANQPETSKKKNINTYIHSIYVYIYTYIHINVYKTKLFSTTICI